MNNSNQSAELNTEDPSFLLTSPHTATRHGRHQLVRKSNTDSYCSEIPNIYLALPALHPAFSYPEDGVLQCFKYIRTTLAASDLHLLEWRETATGFSFNEIVQSWVLARPIASPIDKIRSYIQIPVNRPPRNERRNRNERRLSPCSESSNSQPCSFPLTHHSRMNYARRVHSAC